jgi:hypothetical protein
LIQILDIPTAPDGELDISFSRPPLSDRSGAPILIGVGDPVCGPLIGLFYDDPSTPDQLAGPPDLAPAHSHQCDNFRVVMKGELIVGQERYHHGEFRIQRSGRPYGRDGDAPHVEGNWRIIMFADRRGHRVRPTNSELRAQYAGPEAIARTRAHFGSMLPEILDDDDDGVNGLATSIDKPFSRLGHIDASFEEAGSWEPLASDGRIALTLLGDHQAGPVVILQRTPAGQPATPSFTLDCDVFRCVIRGSLEAEQTVRHMGDTRTQPARHRWAAGVAGPDGVDEVIVIGDRRGLRSLLDGDAIRWADSVIALVDRLSPALASQAST